MKIVTPDVMVFLYCKVGLAGKNTWRKVHFPFFMGRLWIYRNYDPGLYWYNTSHHVINTYITLDPSLGSGHLGYFITSLVSSSIVCKSKSLLPKSGSKAWLIKWVNEYKAGIKFILGVGHTKKLWKKIEYLKLGSWWKCKKGIGKYGQLMITLNKVYIL